MCFFDWNGDGNIDSEDMFLEYNIYRACTDEEDDGLDNYDNYDDFDDLFDDEDEE